MLTMRRTLILLCSAAAFCTSDALSLSAVPSSEVDACATVDCASGLVCGLAIPQSCAVAPCPKMPTCLPKNQTCSTKSCAADETCVLRSVTCIKAPCYPVRECAKFPKCGANEEYNECSLKGPCEPNCKESFPICSDVTCGSGACECKAGYFRHEGKCISKAQCPEPTCEKPNEVWNTCPSACPQTCRILRGKEEQMICPAVCGTPSCTCAAGYVRDDDWNCVKEESCPKEFKCDSPHEQYMECSSHCEPTCENRNPSCIESCGPAKCQCKAGYVRNEGHCLFALQCPQEGNSTTPRPAKDGSGSHESEENSGEKEGASCAGVRCKGDLACSLKGGKAVCAKCGKNEKIDTCPNPCTEASCDDGEIQRDCISIRMCGPQSCVCAEGFVRNIRSGQCVKRSQCPKGDNGTMHILPQIDPIPLITPENNGSIDNGAIHIMPMPANWTKPLIRPMFPNNENGTMHIMPLIDPIPQNWTRPLIRPAFPDNENGTMNILPFYPHGEDDGAVHIMPIGRPKPLIDPIPHNWTRPLTRPFFPDNSTGAANGTIHVDENGTTYEWSRPYVPNFNGSDNATMHILPMPQIHPRPQTRPAFPDNNGTMHIMPLVDPIPRNWTRPLIRPFFPDNENGTMHIMPLIDPIPRNWTRPLIRPAFPDNNRTAEDDGQMHILPFIPEDNVLIDPIPTNRTRPLIRPFFPDNENGTMHIMPLVDPIPRNWTKPLIRPFFPDNSTAENGTMHIMPHFGNGAIHTLPYIPRGEGIYHALPISENDTVHALPWTNPLVRPAFPAGSGGFGGSAQTLPFFPPNSGAVHTRPAFLNGTKQTMPLKNGTAQTLPFFPNHNGTDIGAIHIMPFIPSNSSTPNVCANHTCPAGSWCEETPVMCLVAPCPPIATCVSVSAGGGAAGGSGVARDDPIICGKNEEYSECAPPCQETCRGVDECAGRVIMAAVCTPGCVCKDKFKRDGHGNCVPNQKCWKTAGCQDNESWHKCRTCEATCTDAKEMCAAVCSSGCACDEGYVRSPTGQCIEPEECPKAQNNSTKA